MQSTFVLAPRWGTERDALQLHADMLYQLNLLWIRDTMRRGLRPPLRALSCEPPWCATPPRYVSHHGPQPIGRERDYFDGPQVFHIGEGTCIELASYDAAAATLLELTPSRPIVECVRQRFHCYVRRDKDGATLDSTSKGSTWQVS